MRPRQWTKNIFCFGALVFDGKLLHLPSLATTIFGFILLCLISGTVYIINDLVDVEKDRVHPTKKNRPIASGAVSTQFATISAVVLPLLILPVIGSIVGVQKYVYDIFGPGVNLAARMEAVAKPMQIAMSAELYGMVRSHVRARDVGEREIKGFGRQRVYLLEGSDSIRLAVDDAEDDADDDEPSSPW
jgi:hypothetical protein